MGTTHSVYQTAADLVARCRITDVWHSLGGPPLRHSRGPAWWRNGNRPNVALDDDKGTWYDFARGEGGGVLDLISVVLRCDRSSALRWLADHLRVEIDRPLTPPERRAYAARRRRAEVIADELTQWRAQLLSHLRQRRNAYYDTERLVSRWAREHIADPCAGDDWRWDAVWAHALDGQQGAAIDQEIQRIELMSPAELRQFRGALECPA